MKKFFLLLFVAFLAVFLGCDDGLEVVNVLDVVDDVISEQSEESDFIRSQDRDIILDTEEKLSKIFTIVDDNIFLSNKRGTLIYAFDMQGAFKYKIDMPEEVRIKISGRYWQAKLAGFKPDDNFLIVYLRIYHGLSSNATSDTIYSEVYFREVDSRFEYHKHVRHSFLHSREYDNEDIRLNVSEQTFRIHDKLFYLNVYGDHIKNYHPNAIEIPLGDLDKNWAFQQPFWHKKTQTLYLMENRYGNTYKIVAFVSN